MSAEERSCCERIVDILKPNAFSTSIHKKFLFFKQIYSMSSS